MSALAPQRGVVRSYQRIFVPDRRIFQVEGHRIPIPGGIPLAWLGYATATLALVLVLSGRSLMTSALLAGMASGFAAAVGGRRMALSAALAAFAAAQALGVIFGVLDWPLRLLVVPALVATVGTQATPDGRSAHRYALSWLAVQLRPSRRWSGRALPVDERRSLQVSFDIAPDHRGPIQRRGRITGPATVTPTTPVLLTQSRWPGSRDRAAIGPLEQQPAHRGARLLSEPLALNAGERLEVRP